MIKQQAAASDGDRLVTLMCQKLPNMRSNEEVRAAQAYLSSICYFFSLWPERLACELCRLLNLRILVRGEVVITRGRPSENMYIILNGRL